MDPTEWVSEAVHGPLRLRFVVQPLVALVLGLRDGRRDHADRLRPFVVGLLFAPGPRADRLRAALRQISVPLVVAVGLDAIVQLAMLGYVRLVDALWVGTLLIALPYSVARGFTNRLLVHSRRQRHA